MGLEKTVDDYLHHNKTHPNLHNLFLECGCEDFDLFSSMLYSVVTTVSKEKKAGKTCDFALDEKTSCLGFLVENILIPYCQKNSDRAPSIIAKFNELFESNGYTVSMEDVKANSDKK